MNPLVVYKASAGSGKTFTLAVQYIKLLILAEEPGEYARILAVTFTNKATAEMKDRILSQLFGIGQHLDSSQAYYEALEKALREEGFMYEEEQIRRLCRFVLHQILHDYSRFRVQTIDAFFQMVLRGLAHELGLTANLQVEISDKEVLSKAVDRMVDRLQDDPQVFEWLMSLVREHIDNDQRWDVTREVKNFGLAIFNEDYLMRGDQLRAVLNDTAFMRRFLQQLLEMEKASLASIVSMGNRLEQMVYDEQVSFADFSNGSTLRKFADQLKDGKFPIEIGARIRGWADDPLSLVKKADQKNRPELLGVADQICCLLNEIIEKMEGIEHTVNSARLATAHLKPLCLLDAIDREVALINTETSRFNLAKTPILLNRMIGLSDAPFVFEKLGALLRHVMIDEFQDTSRLQWSNFRTLLLESFAKGGRNLIVGDVKQSIYRWRGGDWRVLGQIQENTSLPILSKRLEVNRRSDRRIIDFNSSFFKDAALVLDRISSDDIAHLGEAFSFAAAYDDVCQLVPDEKPEAGYIRLSVLDGEAYKKRDEWTGEILDDLQQQIRDLRSAGVPYAKMTILVRNNREMAPIIQHFAEAEDWPDRPMIVSDEAFLLSASPAVELLIAALRVLLHPEDRVSAYELQQKAPSLPPEGLNPQWAQLPLYELLETLYRQLDLQQIPHQEAYLHGFFDAVMDFLHSESADIFTFLTFWDERLSRQAIPAGMVDGIRILTIHKAKGLEFHTVFMPFCTWNFESDRSSSLLWCQPTEKPFDALQLLPITPNGKMAPKSIFAHDYAESHLLSRLDELNTLYVGFTRPRSNLFAWAVGKTDGLSSSKRSVGDLIAAVLPEGCEIGDPVLTVRAEKGESDNRMNPLFTPIESFMQSYPMSASFRQSNRSQQFIASLTDETADESLSELTRSNQYIEVGKLLHGILQRMATRADMKKVLDSLEHEGVITRHTPDGSYVSLRRADIERWLDRGLENPKAASWFDGSWQLFNECSIVSLHPETRQMETHRPDRVMISPDKSRVVVVDFKFSHRHSAYDDQVRNYMKLLSAMHPSAQVEGYLWFVTAGLIDPVCATPPATSQLTLDL